MSSPMSSTGGSCSRAVRRPSVIALASVTRSVGTVRAEIGRGRSVVVVIARSPSSKPASYSANQARSASTTACGVA